MLPPRFAQLCRFLPCCRVLWTVLLIPLFPAGAQTPDYVVSTGAASGEGSLASAIAAANSSTNSTFLIQINSGLTIQPSAQLVLSTGNQTMLTLSGGGSTIDMAQANGGTGDRAFFIAGGNVVINNLTIANGKAQGGSGADGGGGGAGLGGAIFIANGSSITGANVTALTQVTLNGVNFLNNTAAGGNGGTITVTGAGGGGGMGGNGAEAHLGTLNESGGGGGGGFGYGANGGTNSSGLPGAFPGGASAGTGSSGMVGGIDGGGGGGASGDLIGQTTGAGGGGIAGGSATSGGAGGQGGFGGGGGGSGLTGEIGGDGGFGGGGGGGNSVGTGSGTKGGHGGFGGGGGFGYSENSDSGGGPGGFGGGAAASLNLVPPGSARYGGGGLGAGGAVFVMSGAQLTIQGGNFAGNNATAGLGSPDNGPNSSYSSQNGSAYGYDLFLGANVTIDVQSGFVTMNALGGAGNTSDPNVSNAPSGQIAQASGGVIKTGNGSLNLTGASYYTGATIVNEGVVELEANASEKGTSHIILGQNPGDDGALILSSGSMISGGSLVMGQSANSTGTLVFAEGNAAIADFGATPITTGDGTGVVIFAQSSSSDGSSPVFEFTNVLNGNISIIQNGSGTTKLAPGGQSLANHFTGSVTINNGTLEIGDNPNAIPSTAGLTMNGGALNLAGNDLFFSTVQLNGGNITSSIRPAAFTANEINTSSGEINAAITGKLDGSFVLRQNGPGTTVINYGASNILGGDVLAQSGNLVISGGASLLHIENLTLTGNGGVTFQGENQSETQNLSIGEDNGAGSNLVIDGGSLRVTNTGGLTLGANGTLTFSGTGGELDVTQIAAGSNGAGQIVFAQSDLRTVTTPYADSISMVQNGNGTTILSGQIVTGNVTVNAGNLQISTSEAWFNFASQGTVEINGGALNLGTPNSYMGTLVMNGGNLGASPSAYVGMLTFTATAGAVDAYVISSTFVKTGPGTMSLAGTADFTTSAEVSGGTLQLNGNMLNDITVSRGGTLAGSGTVVGMISGNGNVAPGNSPGILTASAVDPSGGLVFQFEFTSLNPFFADSNASLNDMLRLTGSTPFSAALSRANEVNIYFNVTGLSEGQVYSGGFFTDATLDFLAQIQDAGFRYYVADAGGTLIYNGVHYKSLDDLSLGVTLSTANQTADFSGGTVNGRILQLQIVPEPSTYAMLGLAFFVFGVWRLRHRSRAR